MPGALGRRAPSDWMHYRSFSLDQVEVPPTDVPVVLGINWYTAFDRPQRVGSQWWIGRGSLGTVRGGHAICARPQGVTDWEAWWEFYDQGSEGACVGFALSRMMTLLNRRRYYAPWLYAEAQRVDEYPDTPPAEGTSVRAGCDVLRTEGHEVVRLGVPRDGPRLLDGISMNVWATSWDQVRSALARPDGADGVPLLNSWGTSYPHVVWLDDDAGARLLDEDGEAAVPYDRV